MTSLARSWFPAMFVVLATLFLTAVDLTASAPESEDVSTEDYRSVLAQMAGDWQVTVYLWNEQAGGVWQEVEVGQLKSRLSENGMSLIIDNIFDREDQEPSQVGFVSVLTIDESVPCIRLMRSEVDGSGVIISTMSVELSPDLSTAMIMNFRSHRGGVLQGPASAAAGCAGPGDARDPRRGDQALRRPCRLAIGQRHVAQLPGEGGVD